MLIHASWVSKKYIHISLQFVCQVINLMYCIHIGILYLSYYPLIHWIVYIHVWGNMKGATYWYKKPIDKLMQVVRVDPRIGPGGVAVVPPEGGSIILYDVMHFNSYIFMDIWSSNLPNSKLPNFQSSKRPNTQTSSFQTF